ncbi:MAG: hypothetical protein WC044_07025 [Crocinitomicaceae bacterium]
MDEKPNINLKRFQPSKMAAKYWVKLLVYGLILVALRFWYQHQVGKRILAKSNLPQQELRFKEVKIQENSDK